MEVEMLKCPFCGSTDLRVTDTRDSPKGLRRRRQCKTCGKRFTTYEIVAATPVVVKRDGRREEFDRNKVLAGIRKACAKRPIPFEVIESIADEVEDKVRSLGKAEVSSRQIGQWVLERLRELDEVAYIRFASVYLPLEDVESIKREIDKLLKEGK